MPAGHVGADGEAEHFENDEDAYWSNRTRDVLASGEPTVAWDEAVRQLETGPGNACG
ncbi:hypothetical protein [Amycolatopsis sp. NPDC051903]|uniref:hypothetical protein n=1 Tax=Amycolatopsis sp. NPDC051903 TaxID=3363936 RepID=UPI0037B9F6FD